MEAFAVIGLILAGPAIWWWLKGSIFASLLALFPCMVLSFFYVEGLDTYLNWVGHTFGIGTFDTITIIIATILAIGGGLAFFPRMMWACTRAGDWINAHDQKIYAAKAKAKAEKKAAKYQAMVSVERP